MTVTDNRPAEAHAIDYGDVAEPEGPTVVTGPGWEQTTPARGDRTYRDVGPGCDVAPATDETFLSVTAMLAKAWPGDFSGPTQAWTVADACSHEFLGLPAEQRKEWLKGARDRHLDAASGRGSAVHRMCEARQRGAEVDHDDLGRHGASEYAPAVEAFFRDCRPEATLIEAVCFDRVNMVAGTVDGYGRLPGVPGLEDLHLVWDYKSRTTSHDRRTKEAAQLGGYASMISGRTGYHLDARGRRCTGPVDAVAVVTFCPDGTYAVHLTLDLDTALAAYDEALSMMRFVSVPKVYTKAHKGAPLDVAAVVAERLGRIERDTPEWMTLTQEWTRHGLPRSASMLTLDDWATADILLTRAEPFRVAEAAPTAYATHEEAGEVEARIRALPAELRAEVLRAGAGIGSLSSGHATVEQVEDWERLVTPAESAADGLAVQLGIVIDQIAGDDAARTAVGLALPELGERAAWTDDLVDRCAEVVDAHLAGDLIVRDGAFIVSPKVIESMTPKTEWTAAAKPVAKALGRTSPRKFADVVNDVALFSALRAECSAASRG